MYSEIVSSIVQSSLVLRSKSVTSEPSDANRVASSTPTTPPPTMESRLKFHCVDFRISWLRITCGSMTPGMSGIIGSEPVAMITRSPLT